MCLHARIRRMVALMLLLHVMFYSLYDARIVVLILTPPLNTTQELSGAQNASKQLEQRVTNCRTGTRTVIG